MQKRARILVVDDTKTQLDWLAEVLEREGYDVCTAVNGADAVRKVGTEAPDLMLLDKILPDMDGIEVVRILKARREEQFLPVIMVSAKSDLESKVQGLRLGADDFLVKPVTEAELVARCAAMLRIKDLQDQLRETQRRLEEQSITDPLTALRNRRFFDERLLEEFNRAQRYSDPVALVMIDIDHFKEVNDHHGHQAGDLVLHDAATLTRGSVRDTDLCVRYGGDEFAVILPKTFLAGALSTAERVRRAFGGRAFAVQSARGATAEVRVTASIGVAVFPSKDIATAEQLLRFADEALYNAKRAGRNTICVYRAPDQRYEAS